MGEKIASENGRIFDFRELMTLTLDRVILHTVMHHSSTSTYIPNFIEIEESFVDGQTDVRTETFETVFIRSTQRNQLKKCYRFQWYLACETSEFTLSKHSLH